MNDENGEPKPVDGAAPDARYVGFWWRTLATAIDSILILVVLGPIAATLFGETDIAIPPAPEEIAGLLGRLAFELILAAVVVVAFWLNRSATPGKLVISARIVDAASGGKPSPRQCIGRYLGYFVSLLPLGLGLLWVGWDRRKQGWHDKLAGTVVVRKRRR